MTFDTVTEFFQTPGLGRVERAIVADKRGRVFFNGTYWPAQFYESEQLAIAEAKTWVSVLGRRGLTLLVVPTVAGVSAKAPWV
ncbi:NfeD family protein [Almyronema epifaneia]|uniref:NfeD family protein n=1 Tax=Almyronema epifaneia S1 TaxID=2991925 RepID=A0ABW6I9Z8_9CYAN